MGVAVGNVGMTEDELISNIMLSINFCNSSPPHFRVLIGRTNSNHFFSGLPPEEGMAKRWQLDHQGQHVPTKASVLDMQVVCNEYWRMELACS
jgi:hypothetical protein